MFQTANQILIVSPIGDMLGIFKQTSLPHYLVHPMNRIRGELNRRKIKAKGVEKPQSYLWDVYNINDRTTF
jgi:hypothetical protein